MSGHVGELLNAWRSRKKWTRQSLAGQAGISRTTLARWEAGQTQPRMAELDAVLTALDASPAQRQEALARIEAPRAVQRLRDAAGTGPAVRGDLLRALRRRQGWTQQETAKRTGIAQGTLARWERSEDWPAADRLHTLCYALRAHEAELLALTLGWAEAAAPPVGRRMDRDAARETVSRHMLDSPLADIEFLALEGQLWHFSQTDETAKVELSHTYGCHARSLADHRRFAEAAAYVKRTHQLAHRGYRDDIGWAAALIAESRVAGVGRRRPHPERALHLLQRGVDDPFLAGRVEYRAWMQSEIAKSLAALGEPESAVLLSRQAIRLAEGVDEAEPWWRRGDHARVLLGCGLGDEALEECRACLSQGTPSVENLPFLRTGAQALTVLGRAGEAADWLQQMEGIIATHPEAAHHRAVGD